MDNCVFCAAYCRPPHLLPVGLLDAPPGEFITPEVGISHDDDDDEENYGDPPPSTPPSLEPFLDSRGKPDSAIQNSLRAILILKRILTIPNEMLCQFLGEKGGQSHPDSWVQTCVSCGELVTQFYEAMKELSKVQKKLIGIEEKLRGKIVDSKDILATSSIWARIRSQVLKDYLAKLFTQQQAKTKAKAPPDKRRKKRKLDDNVDIAGEEWMFGGTVIKSEYGLETHVKLPPPSTSDTDTADENEDNDNEPINFMNDNEETAPFSHPQRPQPPPSLTPTQYQQQQQFGTLWNELNQDHVYMSTTPIYKCYQPDCPFQTTKILQFEAHLKKHLCQAVRFTQSSSISKKATATATSAAANGGGGHRVLSRNPKRDILKPNHVSAIHKRQPRPVRPPSPSKKHKKWVPEKKKSPVHQSQRQQRNMPQPISRPRRKQSLIKTSTKTSTYTQEINRVTIPSSEPSASTPCFISETEEESSSKILNGSTTLTVSIPKPIVLPRNRKARSAALAAAAANLFKRCDQCPFKTRDKIELQNHLKCHLERSKATPCEQCGVYLLPWAHKLASHRRSCVPLSPNVKKTSTEGGNSLEKTVAVVIERLDMDSSPSTSTTTTTTSTSNLNYDVEIQGSKKYLKCRDCPYKSTTEQGIQIHLKLHEEGSTAIPCPDCGYFVLPERLNCHRGAWHATYKTGRKKYYRGSIKGRGRRQQPEPVDDVEVELPPIIPPAHKQIPLFFNCDICPYKTRHKGQLETHLAAHREGSGTSRCADCGWNILLGKHNHHLRFCPDPDGQKEKSFGENGGGGDADVQIPLMNNLLENSISINGGGENEGNPSPSTSSVSF